jgi:hypothetical protein
MKIITTPRVWTTGELLAPEDLDALYLYAKDAVSDRASARWARSWLPVPFVTDVGAPYTEASGALLTFKFTCPTTCIIEGAHLSASMVSSAEVTVSITATSGGATPSGATTPWLSTGGEVLSAAVDTKDENLDRILLAAGTEYSITVASSGTFTLDRFDLMLRIAVDRWCLAGTTSVPAFSPTLLSDASFADATVIAANNTALATEGAKFASALGAVFPILFVHHGLTSGTSNAMRRHTLPRMATARGTMVMKRLYIDAVMAANVTSAVAASVLNAGLVSVGVVSSASLVAASRASGDSGAVSVNLHGADAENTANDYVMQLSSGTATNCLRASALLWVARA